MAAKAGEYSELGCQDSESQDDLHMHAEHLTMVSDGESWHLGEHY